MDSNYDVLAAKAKLSTVVEEYQGRHNDNAVCNDLLSLFKSEEYQIRPFGSPMVYKLVKFSEDISELEEATFTVHGIILEKELPPITPDSHLLRNEKRRQRYAGYIRQYIALTGLDHEEFNESLGGFVKVHRYFQDALPTDKLHPLEPLSINGARALACHTRYFNARRYCQSAVSLPFGPWVDPNDDLKRIAGNSYIHTEDNVVQYLGRKTDDEKSYVYFNINPVRFQKGDIVELTISFLCVPTQTSKFKMITSLKTITLLDDQVREKARNEHTKELLSLKGSNVFLKRRLVETEDESTSSKNARMDLS